MAHDLKMSKVVKNTLITLANQLVNTLFPIIIFGYLARLLTPNLLGDLSLSQSVVSLLAMLIFFGIPIYGVREVAKCRKNREQLKKIVSELFILNLATMIVFYLIFLLIVELYLKNQMDSTLLYIISISVVISPFLMNYVIEGIEEFKFIAVRNVIVKLIALILVIVAVKTKEDIYLYAWIYSLISLLIAVYNIIFIQKKIGFDLRAVRPNAIQLHIREAKVIFITGIISSIYIFVDTIMIGLMSDTTNVANYAVADKVIKLVATSVAVINVVMLPRISSAGNKNNEIETRLETDFICNAILFFCIPASAGMFFLAENIVTLISGIQYQLSITILKIIAINALFIPLTTFIYYQICVPRGRERSLLYATCFGAFLNIIGNLVFIPPYGAIGASYTTLLTEALVLFTAVLMTRGFLNMKVVMQGLWKNLISVFLMIICLYLVKQLEAGEPINLFLLILSGAFVYLSASYFLKDKVIVSLINSRKKSI